jgi:hypothetical protein
VKGWKKDSQANVLKKYAGETILTSDKVDFRLKSVRRKKEVHLMLITIK